MLFVGTSIIHPSTEGVFLLCNILDLLIYRLEFKNVRFQYTKDREVLKKVSFKLEPGEKVAIIGKKWKWKINNFGITITIL